MTERQRVIYNFILQFYQLHGYAPTLTEICSGCHYSSRTYIRETLWRLERLGVLEIGDGKHRAIKIK